MSNYKTKFLVGTKDPGESLQDRINRFFEENELDYIDLKLHTFDSQLVAMIVYEDDGFQQIIPEND